MPDQPLPRTLQSSPKVTLSAPSGPDESRLSPVVCPLSAQELACPLSATALSGLTSDLYPLTSSPQPTEAPLSTLPLAPILGVRVHATTYAAAAAQILAWAQSARSAADSHYVCCAAVHSIMEAHDSPDFRTILNSADFVTSDGMPIVWLQRLLGHSHATRVYGPDLSLVVLAAAAESGVPVGFYGATPAVIRALERRLIARFPALRIVYAESPPFRPATLAEDLATIRAIRQSGVRILFIGLSTPKQDRWMHAHRGKFPGVMLGVGAAFDFLSGSKPQAPRWMQSSGLEWLFRLATEPRRLWRRYFHHNPRFALLACAQFLRSRRSVNRDAIP